MEGFSLGFSEINHLNKVGKAGGDGWEQLRGQNVAEPGFSLKV
jgi:hypothetical protein